MSEPVPPPKDPQHQRFADLVLSGIPAAEAYQQAGFTAKTPASRASGATRLLKNADIAAYIIAKQEKAAETSEVDRDKIIATLTEIVFSPPSKAGMDHPLCELKMSKAGPFAAFPDKSKSIERLCKMLGFDAPEKKEHDVPGLLELAEAMKEAAATVLPIDRI